MRIDILHPTTLLGKEVRDRLPDFPRLAGDVRLLSNRETEVGTLTDVGGAAALVTRLEDDWAPADVALFCGSLADTRALLPRLQNDSTAVVLSQGATEADGAAIVAGVNLDEARQGRVLVSPSAGTVALARLLHPLRGSGLRTVTATVVLPASQGDEDALHELFEQGRAILTFAPQPPSPILGGQLAFNLVQASEPGDGMAAQLGALLQSPDTEIAVHVLQGGIFHGVSTSVYVRLAADPGVKALRLLFKDTAGLEVAKPGQRFGPIDAAQSESLLVGEVRPDVRHPGTYWLWATLDNLTAGGALNALHVAQAAFS